MNSRSRLAVTVALSTATVACAGSSPQRALAPPTTHAASLSPRSPARTTATTTRPPTADPGQLPQTTDRPTTTAAAFTMRVGALWQAIVDGQPAEAMPFFFPLGAYIQLKAVHDPVSDWNVRLVGAYRQDIIALHRALGSTPSAATFVSFDVPAGVATWVYPGTEFNKLGYWRVYGSQLRYAVGGQVRSDPVASLISWRGDWYVVHFAGIR